MFSDDRERRNRLNSTESKIVLLGHISEDPKVSFFSPMLPPGVFHEPVINILLSTISNDENCMVKISIAGPSLHDSSFVSLESEALSIKSNGDWPFNDG